MKIIDFDVFPVRVPYRQARQSTWSVRTGANTIVVRLRDSDGCEGYGDCIFKQGLAAGLELLQRMREFVIGVDVYEIERTISAISVARMWAFKHDQSFVGGPLLAAIEMAMWDLFGRRLKQPVHRLLGGALGDELRFSYQVPATPTEALEREVAFALDKGFASLSVKLAKSTRSIEEDVEVVGRIRALAPSVQLSVDVNGAWTLPTAIRALRKLEKYDLSYVETPVAGLDNLAALRRRVGVPIAADEEACSYQKLLTIIKLQAADVVVLDLPSFGGIRGFQKAADLLEAAHIPAVVHGNGEILTAFASFQLAIAHRQFRLLAHQFYYEHGDHYLMHHPVLDAASPSYKRDEQPGLGFVVDGAKLRAMADAYGESLDTDFTAQNWRDTPQFPKY